MRSTRKTIIYLAITDSGLSKLGNISGAARRTLRYGPFGYLHREEPQSGIGFNGQWLERKATRYLLGNGTRAYSPNLMRFSSPDTLSPFGAGGMGSYSYCLADPINLFDPSGRVPALIALRRLWERSTNSVMGKLSGKRAKSLQNLQINNLRQELLQSTMDSTVKPITVIKKLEDFQALDKDHYKFIFTDRQELLVAPFGSLSHPVIASHAHSTRVVSAGALKGLKSSSIELTNHTGHYRADFASLKHVNKYLRGMGVNTTLIKHK
jgi:RHS repeat-associated protein